MRRKNFVLNALIVVAGLILLSAPNVWADVCVCDFDYDGNVYPSDLSVFLGEYGTTDCDPNGLAPVPRTGQTASYATGDDGHLEPGVEWPTPRFVDNGNGTVTDYLTGLMWMNDYLGSMSNWDQAVLSCYNSADLGYPDWRLPSIKELLSLIDYGRQGPAVPIGIPITILDPNDKLWSSTSLVGGGSAWYISLWNGDTGMSWKSDADKYSLCVRPLHPPIAQWTIMVYMDGDGDLELPMINDFVDEMSTVGSDQNVKIVVLLDRIDRGVNDNQTDYDDWTDARRGLVNYGDIPDTSWGESIGEVNMGDPQTLIDFVLWGMQNYPAMKYGLVLKNHGKGWQGICGDDTSSGDMLYVTGEIRTALESIEISGQRLDLIALDACLMAETEVAYELRDHADVMVASENPMNHGGLPFDTILPDLKATPSMDAETLGSVMVQRCEERYNVWPHRTMSAINLSMISDVASKVDLLANKLINDWFSDPIGCADAASELMTAIDAAVILEAPDPDNVSWQGTNGLTIYFTDSKADYLTKKSWYNQLQFTQNTQWGNFLENYYDYMDPSWVSDARDQSLEMMDFAVYIDLHHFCEKIIELH